MGLPTAIVANMTSEQLEAYTLHLRIEEISQKLKIDDVVPADGDRYVPTLGLSLRCFMAMIEWLTLVLRTTDRRLLHRCTTITVAVSTPANTDTGSAWRTSATS